MLRLCVENKEEQEEDEKIKEENEEEKQIEKIKGGKEEQHVGLKQKKRIAVVFDELCPPPELETLIISGYFGCRLPNWMQASAEMAFMSLRIISLQDITYCTELPDGLCRMLNLEDLEIDNAPAIGRVRPNFQTLASGEGGAAFPKLRELELSGLSGWKKWEWMEEHGKAIAMPALEHLQITHCKLRRLPTGLASNNRYNLRTLYLEKLALLTCVENFPSVVELDVLYCPKLKKISGLSKLRKVFITRCSKLERLEGVVVLESMVLDHKTHATVRGTTKGHQSGQRCLLSRDIIITNGTVKVRNTFRSLA